MRHLVARAGLTASIHCESAGTAVFHVGKPPDKRSAAAAARRGIPLPGSARQFVASDFDRFDYVLAMDTSNFADLQEIAGPSHDKLQLLRDYDPSAGQRASVPDPYYGGEAGFEEVLDQCERACAGLLAHLTQQHSLVRAAT